LDSHLPPSPRLWRTGRGNDTDPSSLRFDAAGGHSVIAHSRGRLCHGDKKGRSQIAPTFLGNKKGGFGAAFGGCIRVCLGFDYVDATAGHLDGAGGSGENGVVSSHADIKAGEEFCAALAQNDVAANYGLASGDFEPQILGVAVAAVTCRTLSLFMCHS
jgi:hypothetical protein